MNLNKQFTILLAGCIALLSMGVSCKDKNKSYCEENPGECANVQEVKDYFYFKQGSWWVYEEETSLERDSVYVTESNNNTGNYDFDVRVYSTFQDYYYHYFPYYLSVNGCKQSGDIYKKCVIINRSKYKPGDFVNEANCFFFKFKKGEYETSFNSVYENNKIIVDEVFETYMLGDLSLNRTVKIYELNTFMEGKQPTNHYYSKGIGLIRKELLDSNEVWNLVNYHIEP